MTTVLSANLQAASLSVVDREGGLAGSICLAVLALRRCPAHWSRQRPVVKLETRRQRHVLRLVHRPVVPGRCKRMVRVRKRGHQEERLVAIASGVAVEPFAAFVSDIGGWIKLFRNWCPERLRANVIVQQLVRTVTTRVG